MPRGWLQTLGGTLGQQPDWFEQNAPAQSATPPPVMRGVPSHAVAYEPPPIPPPPDPEQTSGLSAYEWATWDPTGVNATVERVNELRERAGRRLFGDKGYAWLRSLSDALAEAGSLSGPGPVVGAITPTLPGFYSRVERVVESLPVGKPVPVAKVQSLLQNQASKDEVAWRGLDTFLMGKTQVTRPELEAWLKDHPITLGTVEKSRGTNLVPRMDVFPDPAGSRGWVIYDRRNHTNISEGNSSRTRWFATPDDARRFITERGWDAERVEDVVRATGGEPRWSKYSVPGGEAYTETLTTLSDPTLTSADLATRRQVYAKYDEEINALHRQSVDMSLTPHERLVARTKRDSLEGIREREAQAAAPLPVRQPFISDPHYSERDILGWSRADERRLPSGEKGLFVQEWQSDWHQKGKQKGYKIPELQDADVEMRRIESANPYWESYDKRTGVMITRHPGNMTEAQARREAIGFGPRGNDSAVPDAPFKDSWDDLLFTRDLLRAVERPDLEWIGWTTGATQAERYNLKKFISSVEWEPMSKRLMAHDKDGAVVFQQTVEEADLHKYIGKDAAKRLLDSEEGVLEGEALEVGGEGMGKFYDELRVRRAEKRLAPFGAKVEPGHVPHSPGDLTGPMERIWKVRLTPEIKAKIKAAIAKGGFPLLATAPWMIPLADAMRPVPSHEQTR